MDKKNSVNYLRIAAFFLLIIFLFQIFYLNNIPKISSEDEVLFCENFINYTNKEINSYLEEDFLIGSIDIPLIPEIQNFGCLNKVQQISLDSKSSMTVLYYAENSVVFNMILVALIFLNYLVYIKFKVREILFINYLFLINLYILLKVNFIFYEIIYFGFLMLVPLFALEIGHKLLGSRYIFLLVIFLGLILQIKYLSKEVVDWDISTFLIMGQDINRGYLPYENQLELKPVLIFYAYSIIDFLSDGDLKLVKILNKVPLIVSSFFMFKTFKIKTDSSFAAIGTLIFLTYMSISYYGVPGYSELYSLVPLAYIFYKLETRTTANYLLIGLLFAISTLFNLGSSPAFIGVLIFVYLNKRKELFKLIFGFVIPHLFILIIYAINNLFQIYLQANLLIPLNYNSTSIIEKSKATFFGLYGAINGLRSVSTFLYFFTILILFSIFYFKYFRKEPNRFKSLSFFFISSLISYFLGGETPHHMIFTIYFFCFYIAYLNLNFFRKLVAPAFLIVYLALFNSYSQDIFENVKNYRIIDTRYQLKHVADHLYKNYEFETVLAVDYSLILYYLDLPNNSYVNHPANIFNYDVNIFLPAEVNKGNTFNKLISNLPDIIICNDGKFEFCKEVLGYERLDIFEDIFFGNIYKKK